MKTKNSCFLFILFLSLNSFCQSIKTCESSEEKLVDLNVINKCDIENKKIRKREITTNITSKRKNNRTSHYIRKETALMLFTIVDEIPLFKKCKNPKDKKCFSNEFYNHFSKNFSPEKASDNGIKKRVFVQFIINTNGSISNILIKNSKKRRKIKK